ncbi:MAG: YjbQ family protein [Deltaproteobacteria bacterium]|nr:MAG: YjbQ family protein [Deltaproteobacteria bacterium]
MKTIRVSTKRSQEFVDITQQVKLVLRDSGVSSGVCVVYVPHTTAGVTINENADPDVQQDILEVLEKLVPSSGKYRHREGNAHAHVKSTLVGCSVAIPIEAGRLVLGTWQGIFFCEFDGPRERRVVVKITGRE